MCGCIQNSIWRDKVLNPTSFKAFQWWGKESKCELCLKEDQVLWHWTRTPSHNYPMWESLFLVSCAVGRKRRSAGSPKFTQLQCGRNGGLEPPSAVLSTLSECPSLSFPKTPWKFKHKCFSPEGFSSARGELDWGEHAGKALALVRGSSCRSQLRLELWL